MPNIYFTFALYLGTVVELAVADADVVVDPVDGAQRQVNVQTHHTSDVPQ